MREHRDVLMTKDNEAMFIRGFVMKSFASLIGRLGVLQRLPAVLVPGLPLLFLMGFRRAAVSMRRDVMHLGRPLMILVMRSVVVASRHAKDSRSGPTCYAPLRPTHEPGWNTPALAVHAISRPRCRPSHCAQQRCDGIAPQVHVVWRLLDVT